MTAEWRAMHEQNRKSWNAVAAAHNSHKRDQGEFLATGGSTLFPDERELLGDVAGKRIAHLQCNCGQDSLSLASLGADVTGVDISDAAIAVAQGLSETSGIRCEFVRSDLFDWLESTDARFDIAFASYGCVGWLSDLDRWARGVRRILNPGGRLVWIEFHPLVWSLGEAGLTGDSYFVPEPISDPDGVPDYVGDALAPSGFDPGVGDFRNTEPSFSFQWTAAMIVQAIVGSGMALDVIREYPYANGCELFEGMRRIEGNRYTVPQGMASVPLMLALCATRGHAVDAD